MKKLRKESKWSKLVKQYGVKGAKKYMEEVDKKIALKRLEDKTDPIVTIEEVLIKAEEKPIEQIPEKDARDDIKHRSDKVRQTALTEGWREYIRPRIEACIELYKNVYDDVQSFDEMRVNQAVRKELTAILADIDRWVNERKELMEEEKEDAGEK